MKQYFIAIMLLALATSSYAVVNETISDSGRVVVTLINQEPDPVSPGNSVDLRFRIENRGGDTLKDVEVKLEPEFPLTQYGHQEPACSSASLRHSSAEGGVAGFK